MNTHTRPVFTVVIPTHNRCELLRAAVASVRTQTFSSWELCIVDDGSTDATAALLAQLSDERVTTVHHEHPKGVSAARNAGIARARGEIIAFLDDDDEYKPDFLAAMAQVFTGPAAPDVAWIGGVAPDTRRGRARRGIARGRALNSPRSLKAVSAIGLCARARDFATLGGFDEDMMVSEDVDLVLRFAGAGRKYLHVARPLVYNRDGPYARLSRSRDYEAIARSQARLVTKNAVFLKDRPELWIHYVGTLVGAYYRAGDRRAARAAMGRLLRRHPLSLKSWERLLRFETHGLRARLRRGLGARASGSGG